MTATSGESAVVVYRTLFLAYPDALVVADAAGRIVLANPSAAALLGYEVDELVGLAIDALVPDAVRDRHAAYRESFNDDPRARPMGRQTELVARRKDGSEVVVEIALSPLQDHGLPLHAEPAEHALEISLGHTLDQRPAGRGRGHGVIERLCRAGLQERDREHGDAPLLPRLPRVVRPERRRLREEHSPVGREAGQ